LASSAFAVPADTLNIVAELDIRESVPLAPFTTFGIGGPARYFAQAATPVHVQQAHAWAVRSLPLFVLGGGSNLLVRDTGFPGLVLHMRIRGRNHLGGGVFAVGAGEDWDDFVTDAIQKRFAGIECLAGIPGSVGGTPVQNVGAYGQEVAETILSVSAYDLHSREVVTLNKEECRFRYRESRFNADEPGRYIVQRVDFQLRAEGAPSLRYAELQRALAHRPHPSLAEVATAVRDLRRRKGMLLVPGDPDCRSAGSFFKNPIIAAEELPRIATAAGVAPQDVPQWAAADQRIKLPAAWLLERAGFHKGYAEGAAGLSSRHTLALINRGGATSADIERLQDQIVATVAAKFDLKLEREPVLLGDKPATGNQQATT
jgi:UDP-N-acetylmuramate dehydrogenase